NGGSSLDGHNPSAVVYNNHLDVFITGHDGNLYDHWEGGGSWHFSNHHNGGGGFHGTPAALVYSNSLHVFLQGDDGNLYAPFWDGAAWHTDNHEAGDGGFTINRPSDHLEGAPTVVSYNGDLHVFAVVTTFANPPGEYSSTTLWDHYWHWDSWTWDDHGTL